MPNFSHLLSYERESKWKSRLVVALWILLALGAIAGVAKVIHDFNSGDAQTRSEARGFVAGFLTGFSRLPGGIIERP